MTPGLYVLLAEFGTPGIGTKLGKGPCFEADYGGFVHTRGFIKLTQTH